MNISNHGPEHLDKLAHKQLLPAFLDLVKSQDADMIRLGLGYIELLLTQSSKVRINKSNKKKTLYIHQNTSS
jgi:hypothetical protein